MRPLSFRNLRRDMVSFALIIAMNTSKITLMPLHVLLRWDVAVRPDTCDPRAGEWAVIASNQRPERGTSFAGNRSVERLRRALCRAPGKLRSAGTTGSIRSLLQFDRLVYLHED
jgi:hypothetical protein